MKHTNVVHVLRGCGVRTVPACEEYWWKYYDGVVSEPSLGENRSDFTFTWHRILVGPFVMRV